MSRARFVLFTLFVAALAWTSRARAQSVDIRAAVDNDTVEVGDTLIYTLNVSVRGSGEQATDPQPGAHAGFDVLGTSSAPVHMNMNFNGQRSSVDNLTTTWTLRATRTGQFTLGPASAEVGGARRSAGAVRVTVVPRGKAPRRPRSNNPFDPFGGGGTG